MRKLDRGIEVGNCWVCMGNYTKFLSYINKTRSGRESGGWIVRQGWDMDRPACLDWE